MRGFHELGRSDWGVDMIRPRAFLNIDFFTFPASCRTLASLLEIPALVKYVQLLMVEEMALGNSGREVALGAARHSVRRGFVRRRPQTEFGLSSGCLRQSSLVSAVGIAQW